ncbi:dCTP deaminase domain-containing protein [Alienimonas sp. DA493]|uniref:dCTP deaminase n=1 Tax=Alienimonas sp. DA493 TaxID=3373605 RepID=UPI0037543A24
MTQQRPDDPVPNPSTITMQDEREPPVSPGGVLTGPEIGYLVGRGDIEIDPFDPERLNPNSYDLTLAPEVLVYQPSDGGFDTKTRQWCNFELRMGGPAGPQKVTLTDEGHWFFPGDCVLASTVERTYTPNHVPRIKAKSSVGRMFVEVGRSAAFGDVGFNNTWTLPLTFAVPVKLYPGIRFAQVYFSTVVGEREAYSGRYQHKPAGVQAATADGGRI